MNLNLTKLFGQSSPNVEVIAGRDMIVTVPDGTTRSVTVGDRFEVTKEELARYERGDLLVQGKPASTNKLVDPTPPRPSPTPAPDAWRDLPKSFTQWHELNDRFRCLRQHLRDIDATRVRLFGSAINFAALRGGASAIGMQYVEAKNPQHNPQVIHHHIDFNCPKTIHNDQRLTAAHDAASDELERLTEKSEVTVQKLFLECGNHRIRNSEALQAVIDELGQIGLEIFRLRVSALGLSERHINSLFMGSADHIAYVHPPAYSGGMCVLRCVDGVTEVYGEEGPPQQAGHLLGETLRLAELKTVLAEARRTLLKTRKFAA
jgi:hypothetical protein